MRVSTGLLATLLIAAGATHLVRPRIYEPIVPRWVPGTRRQVVAASGIAELAVGVAVAAPRTRRVGALAAAALFVAVFPSNVEAFRRARTRRGRVVAAVRLPLQLPLVVWALDEVRRETDPR